MKYAIDMQKMVVRSSDGRMAPIGEHFSRNTIVAIVEPEPGATYELVDGDDRIAVSSWREFMRLLGILV